MTSAEAKSLIETDPDFIHVKRFDYSLAKLTDRYPEGAPTKVIAQALMMTEDEVEELYQQIILKMRTALKVDLD
jgi:hypothetical protein